ncbi:uncharacterized protein METZ01_LOCUS492187, partial [marine metagenome]
MRRRYTAEEFLDTTNLIRDAIENVAITGDLIVGFPGENESDFENTLQLVSKLQFS